MLFMFDVFYNGYMPKRISAEEKKDFQIGFRITRLQRERLNLLVARVKLQDKRVEASEVYEELMSLKAAEFISAKDREFLSGRLKTLPELKQMDSGHGTLADDRPRKPR